MTTIQEYVIFLKEEDAIHNNGTRFGTFDMLRADFPQAAIIPADEMPENWPDMTVENGQLVPASAEVLEARRKAENTRKAEVLRAERDGLLAETDKYMILDSPISEKEREQYRAYRQYLRDLPEADGFPDVPVMTFGEFAGTK